MTAMYLSGTAHFLGDRQDRRFWPVTTSGNRAQRRAAERNARRSHGPRGPSAAGRDARRA